MADAYHFVLEHDNGSDHKTVHRMTESRAIKWATQWLLDSIGRRRGHVSISRMPHYDPVGYVVRYQDLGPVTWENPEDEAALVNAAEAAHAKLGE